MTVTSTKRIFIAGGTGVLAQWVTSILLDRDAAVTVLVHESSSALDGRATVIQGDPWNPASLRGRARGHDVVLHLVGSLRADPRRGLTFKQINHVSARNIATMAMNDGVPHVILLSASANPLGIPPAYLESKRDAEHDVKQVGIAWTIVRAPTLYVPGTRRHSLYQIFSLLGYIPPFNWLLAAHRPMSIETAAFGLAKLALSARAGENRMIGPRRLRHLGHVMAREQPRPSAFLPAAAESEEESNRTNPLSAGRRNRNLRK